MPPLFSINCLKNSQNAQLPEVLRNGSHKRGLGRKITISDTCSIKKKTRKTFKPRRLGIKQFVTYQNGNVFLENLKYC